MPSTLTVAPLVATAAMATACAVLSVFVVARRWAFIGEGISHSGFGGAGLAWLLMLAFPSLLDSPGVSYAAVILFCLGTAVAIGYLSRGDRVAGDAAIGIFLVASLAFGFLAQQIFRHVRGTDPADFTAYLFGQRDFSDISPALAAGVIAVSVAVLVTVFALGKEILSYCFDPLMAEASGVRAGFIHYLLMILIALTIIVGLPITGSVLVTALLVLPGVTATMLTQRLGRVIAIAVAAALVAAVAGVCVNATWRFIPIGPAIVLVLFAQFLLAFAAARLGLAPVAAR
ncbi:MAG: metal ABC transporter permease [Tepidisphaeraceae bacterium]